MMTDPDEIEEDLGGVQGSDDGDAGNAPGNGAKQIDGGEPVEAPDAGEIEWAGGLVKRAPGDPTS